MKKTLSFILILILPTVQGFACSCFQSNESLSKQVEQSFDTDLILSGKVVGIENENGREIEFSDNLIIYKFEVIEMIKGEPKTKVVNIASAADGASCGSSFQQGETYLVYAYSASTKSPTHQFRTNLCNRNQRLKDVDKKELKVLMQLARKHRN